MISVTGSIGSFSITWTPVYEPDVAGYVICAEPGTSDFAVSGSNVINIGPEASFTYYTNVVGDFAVKVAAYDSFSDPKNLILSDLNFSTVYTVTVIGLVTEVLDSLNGQITEDHLYSALNSRIDLIDDPTTGLLTLFPRVSMTEGQYTLKLNNNGHIAGFGLANTAYNGVPSSEFMILADKFKVVNPSLPDDKKQVFTVGTVNGVTGVVGINGALIIDGSLVVSQNVSVGGSVSIGGATLTFSAPTPSGIGAVATDLTNAPSTILNSNVTATSIGAVKTDLTNAPSGIVNSNISISSSGALSGAGGGSVTLSGLGYTVPTYDLIGGTKPPTDADKTSTILGNTGTLTLNQALTINSLLTVSGSAAGITSGLASYNADGTGFWISKDTSNARMRVGTVSGGVLTSGFVWDGSTLSIRGTITADDLISGSEIYINTTQDENSMALSVDISSSSKGAVYIRNSNRTCTIPVLDIYSGSKTGAPYSSAPAIRATTNGPDISAIEGLSGSGYGLYGSGIKGAVKLDPLISAGTPSTASSVGALHCDSNGVLYIYTPTGWVKVGSQ